MGQRAPRVVFDTNVLISAYGFGGKPALAVRAAIDGRLELLTSSAILTELADKLGGVLGFEAAAVEEVVRQMVRLGTVIRPKRRLEVVADDADNRVLECAVEGAADLIVSGDHHLLDLGSFEGVGIVRVAELLGTGL